MNTDIFKELFPEYDSHRISKPLDTMFLILGKKKNTVDTNESYWEDQDGIRQDWEYLEERCIAMGRTEEELIESAKEYKRISQMKWSDYFREILNASEDVCKRLEELENCK